MKVINLGATSSVINCYMAQLRDVTVQGNRTLFRNNLERIGHAMAYEVSRTLNFSPKTIQTPLGVKEVETYDDHIVVGTVLRAGLAFHEGFIDVFDQADSAFVAAYREEGKRRISRFISNISPHHSSMALLSSWSTPCWQRAEVSNSPIRHSSTTVRLRSSTSV